MTILLYGLAAWLTLSIGGTAVALLILTVLDRREQRRSRRRASLFGTQNSANTIVQWDPTTFPAWVNPPTARHRGEGPCCPVIHLADHRPHRGDAA